MEQYSVKKINIPTIRIFNQQLGKNIHIPTTLIENIEEQEGYKIITFTNQKKKKWPSGLVKAFLNEF